MSIENLGKQVELSRNAVWRRVKAVKTWLYQNKVAIIDPQKLEEQTVQTLPQIQSIHRMSGDLNYLIIARVANMVEYDQLYQR